MDLKDLASGSMSNCYTWDNIISPRYVYACQPVPENDNKNRFFVSCSLSLAVYSYVMSCPIIDKSGAAAAEHVRGARRSGACQGGVRPIDRKEHGLRFREVYYQ